MKVTKQWFPTYLELEHIVGDWRATVRLRHWRKRLTFKGVVRDSATFPYLLSEID